MSFYSLALDAFRTGEEFCLAVLVAKSGSAPQVPGAKALFYRDGRIAGTIGGGCLEMECRRLALEALASGKAMRREFQLDDDFGWDDGLICGGRVQVLLIPSATSYVDAYEAALQRSYGAVVYDLISGAAQFVSEGIIAETATLRRREVLEGSEFAEPVMPEERLFIFGAGHVGGEVGKLASSLGFAVTIVDDRGEFVTEERTPWAFERVCAEPQEYARQLITSDDDYLCLATRGHRNDSRVLKELIQMPCAYIGMIGSKRKREVVRNEMITEGFCTPAEFDRVRSPMGLDIKAESVPEIAVSIAAELVQVRANRRGPSLARCGQKALVSD